MENDFTGYDMGFVITKKQLEILDNIYELERRKKKNEERKNKLLKLNGMDKH